MAQCGVAVTPEFGAILDAEPRELIVPGGWRGGKSTALGGKIEKRIPFWYAENALTGKTFLVWLVGPDYVQTRQEFRYIEQWSRGLGLVEKANTPDEGGWTLWLKGGITIETKSAAHPERLGAVAPDFIGVCEAGQCSDETRIMMLGRAAEKRANICYAGTIEDDEGHQQWAWYQELSQKWLNGAKCERAEEHDCAAEHNCLSLPSWANRVVYPGGREDPEIKRLEELYDPWTFARRIAAVPTGVQFAVYPQLTAKSLLLPMPQTTRLSPVQASVGGVDYGTVHPSALVVIQVFEDPRDRQVSFVGPRGVAWVRECRYLRDGGDTFSLSKARKELSERWRCYRWNVDPNERYLAKSWQGEATSYSESAREARIGLVTARLNLNKLFFDMDGPGVPELYEEMKRVHRRKTQDGQLKIVRVDDDGTAALEDADEAVDGKPAIILPQTQAIRSPARVQPKRREYVRRV